MSNLIGISALVVSIIVAIGGCIAGFHIKKSKCMGNNCECETEEEKKKRNNSLNNSPVNKKEFEYIIKLDDLTINQIDPNGHISNV
jgi:hypothetical protein